MDFSSLHHAGQLFVLPNAWTSARPERCSERDFPQWAAPA
ncbi:isocitrate lyase/phosphoenolpyruvate mutase family protein [Paeniglutamicibacter gangotriensis]|nr:isocitrate lyase/phosphoenolpyruvate mutase family protein [Paeniglutamicibacter gangotriensis]